MSEPDRMFQRTSRQLEVADFLVDLAERAHMGDYMFGLGGLVQADIRWGRAHDDIDFIVQGRAQCMDLFAALQEEGITAHQKLPLRGSSLFHLHYRKSEVGSIAIRYVREEVCNGIRVWVHDVPGWASPLLGFHELAIPDSAFSLPQERITYVRHSCRFIYPEYSALVKIGSHEPKDEFDEQIFAHTADPQRQERIWHDATLSGTILHLPNFLVPLSRGYTRHH